MCGIVGAVASRSVSQIMLEGLKRLEYRGYDSAGLAIIEPNASDITRLRTIGKVKHLETALKQRPILGSTSIAHTRWATHGKPSEQNAHPHCCHQGKIAVVHNGIIENHQALRAKLSEHGYHFITETDTEIVVHLLDYYKRQSDTFIEAIHRSCQDLVGAYALGIITVDFPDHLYAVRCGSPLVLGLGIEEHFIASDPLALLPVTQQFIYLEEGDVAQLTPDQRVIFDKQGQVVDRSVHAFEADAELTTKGKYRHYMQKEIFEQQQAVIDTINGYVGDQGVLPDSFGHFAAKVFKNINAIHICACGSSYHAGLVAKYWLESLAKIPCQVEIASEFRYREAVVLPNTLFVALSQSGETADTLAALQVAKQRGFYASLGISNVVKSALMREADLSFLTHAGNEIGVAATKTFTAQLVALLLLTLCLKQIKQSTDVTESLVHLNHLPAWVQQTLALNQSVETLAHEFVHRQHALFLGRGIYYPIALEGALKLKEISYLHAEAYPAGELKHGALALVDQTMPVIVVAPNNTLIEKLASNIQEVRARQGEVYVFADENLAWPADDNMTIIRVPAVPDLVAPIIYNLPLQLLAYHIAVLKGTDVDQPRNLAKSVTVE